MKLKIVPIYDPDILALAQRVQVSLKSSQLKIFSFIKRQDRNSIVQLHCIGVARIVHKNHLGKISVYTRKVLHKQIRSKLSAMVPIKSVIYKSSIGVKQIKNGICVLPMTSSEDYDFPSFLHFFEKSNCIGTDIKTYFIVISF